jgi:hypothetical protein
MSINNFLAEVKRSGLAKSSRYMVVIDLPRGPVANTNGIVNPWNTDYFRRNVNQQYTSLSAGQRLTSLYCEATALPSLNIDTKVNKVYGPGREMPYGRSYTPVNFTFYIDRDYIVKKFFDTWMSTIYDEDTGHMNYYNEYTTSVHILALDATDGEVSGDLGGYGGDFRARYQCTLVEAYPKTIAEIAYGAGNSDVPRLQVSMQFRKWTETTVPFGVGSIGSTPDVPFNITYNPSTGSTEARGLGRPINDPIDDYN